MDYKINSLFMPWFNLNSQSGTFLAKYEFSQAASARVV